jgi:amino acid efflux transporter
VTLSKPQAVALAFGSIAGAGIHVLPSAVYAETGTSSLLVRSLAAVTCIPMLMMFEEVVGYGAEGGAEPSFITLGLGKRIGGAIAPMFVCVVGLGLPAGALAAGTYMEMATGLGFAAESVTLGLLGYAVASNRLGAPVNSLVQLLGSTVLVAMAVVRSASARSSCTVFTQPTTATSAPGKRTSTTSMDFRTGRSGEDTAAARAASQASRPSTGRRRC